MANEVDVVLSWHEALNAGNPDALAALTDEAAEVGGPRGTGRGVALVRDWAGRAGVRLDPRRVLHRGDAVVVEEVARWRDVPGRRRPGNPRGALRGPGVGAGVGGPRTNGPGRTESAGESGRGVMLGR